MSNFREPFSRKSQNYIDTTNLLDSVPKYDSLIIILLLTFIKWPIWVFIELIEIFCITILIEAFILKSKYCYMNRLLKNPPKGPQYFSYNLASK